MITTLSFFCIDRNAVDPFVNGGMKGSNSETFLTRVAEPPPNEDFGLANGLNDLSGVVRITVIFVKKMFVCHASFTTVFSILEIHTGAKKHILSKKSHVQNHIFQEINIFKIAFSAKFTCSKSHISRN